MITFIFALHNEASRFPPKFQEFFQFTKTLQEEWELILVDDGSSDSTLAMIQEISSGHHNIRWLSLKNNLGQGAAVKIGSLASQGHIVIYMDADLSVSLNVIPILIRHIQVGHDIVLTSRWMPGATISVPQPKIRQILGKYYYNLIHLFFLKNIHDTNCGMKAYRGEVARFIFGFVRSWRWAFNVESLILARDFGFNIYEHPIEWKNDPNSRVHLFRDILMTIWELFTIKLRQFFGIYPKIHHIERANCGTHSV